MISKVSGFSQMQMLTPNAANVVWQANFWVPKIPLKELPKKQVFLVQKPLFSYISALVGPSLTLFNTQTPLLALLGEICRLSVKGGRGKDIHYAFFGNVERGKSALFRLVVRNGFAHFIRKVLARRKLLPGKFWVFAPLLATSCP